MEMLFDLREGDAWVRPTEGTSIMFIPRGLFPKKEDFD